MPGSGKSSVAAELAARLNRTLLDTDAVIEADAGMPIPEIFSRFGEPEFRRLEKQACADCGKQNGKVIATGGGIVLFSENIDALQQNGRIYFLERALSALATDGRPLSKGGAEALEALFVKRMPLYLAAGDRVIPNNTTVSAAADQIQEDFYETVGH